MADSGASQWYAALQSEVQKTLGSLLQGNFTSLQTTNDVFYWNWWNLTSNPAAFNVQAYNVISGIGQAGPIAEMVSVIGANTFPLA